MRKELELASIEFCGIAASTSTPGHRIIKIAVNSAFNIGTIMVPASASVSVEFDNKGAIVSHDMAFHERWPSIGISLSQIPGAEPVTANFTAPDDAGIYSFRNAMFTQQ
ncbi:MAG: cupredoxin domain-containing protein [Methanotrichaceae archaeon]|nr:cupredoxin domain-containing protein [Methanotrichaceae archaeon]